MERERKFVVRQRPKGLLKRPHQQIRQGYLALPDGAGKRPTEIRVRDEGGRHVLTVKTGRGQDRTEVEVPIATKSFGSLWRLTAGKRVEKTRYRIPLGELTVELDVYRGKLHGLMTAEVEFDSERQLRRFRPPEWLGQEVTGQEAFGNARLATAAAPPRIR